MCKVSEIVTNKIIEELEKGLIPWKKPWSGQGKCINYLTRKSYSFLNEMLLGRPGEYLTFKQVQKLGGTVKKGSKASMVTFWKFLIVEESNKKGEKVEKKVPMLRYYNVFHIDQTEGIESKLSETDKVFNDVEVAEETVKKYFEKYGIKFELIAGDKAYYSPSSDKVVLPLKKQFESENEYYSVLFHEATHSTGHKERLNRLSEMVAFGDETYSKEELVAEIGSATIMNTFGIDTEGTLKNSAGYIQSWLKVLRNDKNFIISASSRSVKAVDMILDRVKDEKESDEE